MMAAAGRFDRDASLADLLAGDALERVRALLRRSLGEDHALVDARGRLMSGREQHDGRQVALQTGIDPIGYLSAAGADDAMLSSVAGWLTAWLASADKYRMASELHLEAVAADFAALQARNEALQQSEERYRILAQDLERRVREQVAVIEVAQRQLYQADKLASVGQLAAGMAHEINNPVGFARSNLATARRYVALLQQLEVRVRDGDSAALAAWWAQEDLSFVLEDFSSLVAESMDGLDRVARIVADLKAFSRIDDGQRQRVDLNDNLRAACHVVEPWLAGRIGLTFEPGALPGVECDPGHINQMLLNLLRNAIQSIEGDGLIRIDSQVCDTGVQIHIADSGCGMSPEVLARAFDPFFTTRPVGAGVGLGLTVSRDIVLSHGGTIVLDSVPGQGTRVTINLPVSRGA